ncbi:unnamed protein product [Phytophthora fragariaefolia]|uniref:Unnamed protein product n=1 Tax=Phytophthora fragariaefolia TaxID=1490495 RepID=A0A9W6X4Z1_9STRA|nr:unnamed protein product [Phytophthora fragariaefolia]
MKVDNGCRLESADFMSAVLPSTATYFAFDGTNSDLARQLYLRAKVDESVDQLANFYVPDKVQQRLDFLGVKWNDLSGIAQLALLWDTGFGITIDNKPVQIWTLGGHSMSDLAIPLVQFRDVGCVEMNCTQPDNTLSYSNLYCNGEQMLNAARCIMTDFVDPKAIHEAMWITGGNPKVIPVPRARKHAWVDDYSNISYTVLAVHTVEGNNEPAYGMCATSDQNEGYGSLVLACHTTMNVSDAVWAAREEVTGTPWVSRWLVEDYGSGDEGVSGNSIAKMPAEVHDGLNMWLLIPIIAGAVVFGGLLVLVVCIIRQRSQRTANESDHGNMHGHGRMQSSNNLPSPEVPYQACKDTVPEDETISRSRQAIGTIESSLVSRRSVDSTIRFKTRFQEDLSTGSNYTLNKLLGSEHLVGKRVSYEAIKFEKALSKGANGEVWRATFQGHAVAVKRLLQTNTHRADEVEDFAQEIELSASLVHPNIVSFIAVAWNSLNNLVMLLEFFPAGDLQSYLKKNGENLSWAKDKIHIATGIGRAVHYLHSREPPLIHRDLKSKNVMLTNMLEAKIIDFRVSRARQEYSMTADVGTPYWTAPEILEGKRYTEQADIYSFGVILSELDTGKLPYHDALRPDGKKPRPFQIMEEVMAGKLRPSFLKDCPVRIHRVGEACCLHDPNQRPTADQVIRMLDGRE